MSFRAEEFDLYNGCALSELLVKLFHLLCNVIVFNRWDIRILQLLKIIDSAYALRVQIFISKLSTRKSVSWQSDVLPVRPIDFPLKEGG
jgi:hypothetical protein